MKKRSGLYEYLENCGVLENGTREDIGNAKKAFWTGVRKEWRKQQRKECKSYTVFFTKNEQRVMSTAAKNKSTSITGFIKQSAILASRGNTGIDSKTLGEVRGIFFEVYSQVESLYSNEKEKLRTQLLHHFIQLEERVLSLIK